METENWAILGHLFAAVLAGALIGLERTYHGRPAGFRTHVLVCLASSLLMVLSTQKAAVLSGIPLDAIRVDPARMAQGIMTGIGFLGAGVIMKDGLSVRGLTTAASIWITAAIGIIIGIGFYFPAAVATVVTLMTLSLFRWLERIAPTLVFARLMVRFGHDNALTEEALRALIQQQHLRPLKIAYRTTQGGKYLEYEMTVQTRQAADFGRLAERLRRVPEVLDYELTPAEEK